MYRAGHCELNPVGPKKNYRINSESCWQCISFTLDCLFLFQSHRRGEWFPLMQKMHHVPKRKEVVDAKKPQNLKQKSSNAQPSSSSRIKAIIGPCKTHICDHLISRVAIQSIQIFGDWSAPRISHSPFVNSSFLFSKLHTSEKFLRIELKQ